MICGGYAQKPKPHIVAVPFIGQGHLIPFLELSRSLASQGLVVSYVTTPGNVSYLQPQVQSNPDIYFISLPMPTTEGSLPGIESTEDLPFHVALPVSDKLAGPFEQWLHDHVRTSAHPAVCIVSDLFTGWSQDVGAKFEIPTVYFHTSGAVGMSVMHSILNYTPEMTDEGDDLFAVPKLSFDLKLRKSDLDIAMPDDPRRNPVVRSVQEHVNRSMKGRGILFNTFDDLEHLGIEHLKKLTGRPLWSIGPLLPPHFLNGRGVGMSDRGKPADINETECLRWLNSRSLHSVVYICFGSQKFLNDKQIRALAGGVESSQQSFIWVIRRGHGQSHDEQSALPEGFEERTKERGLIIWGWAPQLLILSHPCIGAFLSHCGWNSTLESVSVGVPTITWPTFAEQPVNSKLLVEYVGTGTQLCAGADAIPTEEDVKIAITKLLADDQGKRMRRRAQELRNLAIKAIADGGSSRANLQSFVNEMHKLVGDQALRLHGAAEVMGDGFNPAANCGE